MRILHFIDRLGLGGKERRLVELLKGLETRKFIKHELVVMSNDIFFSDVHRLQPKIHSFFAKSKMQLEYRFHNLFY